MVPKDTYEIIEGVSHSVYYKEDSLYYYVKEPIHCTEEVCTGGYQQIEVISVRNDKFVKNTRNKLMSYITFEEYPAT